VTREAAERLAKLAKSLGRSGHTPHAVAAFLMRRLFTLFAEDVHSLSKDAFLNLLKSLRFDPRRFVPMVRESFGTG
jgi:hypothetical protein